MQSTARRFFSLRQLSQAIAGIVADAAIDLYIAEQATATNRTLAAVREELLPKTPISQAQSSSLPTESRTNSRPIEQVAAQIQQYETQREALKSKR